MLKRKSISSEKFTAQNGPIKLSLNNDEILICIERIFRTTKTKKNSSEYEVKTGHSNMSGFKRKMF